MRHVVATVAAIVWVSTLAARAQADELVAIKPGVMCVSSDALARLTLPTGDSRTHAAVPQIGDLNAAAAGGCIDIPLGARVQVQQAYRNTSRVTYAGAPVAGVLTVPNIDFQPAWGAYAAASGEDIPAGLAVAQRLPAGGGMVLVVLQDSRMTPAIRDAMEPSGGEPELAFADNPRLRAEFNAHPLRKGQLLLQSAEGRVISRTLFDSSFASIKPALLHGLRVPTFLFEVDYSAGTGSTGPATQLLAPVQRGLTPLEAIPDRGGPSKPISLNSTMREMWQIAPSRKGGTEEIEDVQCWNRGDGTGEGARHLSTYRLQDGRWTLATRIQGDCAELEAFPDRSLFP